MLSLFRRIHTSFMKRQYSDVLTRNGISFIIDSSLITKDIQKAIFTGQYEAEELSLVRQAIQTNDVVVEIGACTGYVSLHCAAIVGPERITVFEPNPIAVQLINKNFKLNDWDVNVENKAVSTFNGEMEFFFDKNLFSSSYINRKGLPATKIECISYQSVLSQYKPTALIIDAEGAEIDILANSEHEGVKKIIIELHPHIIGDAKISFLIEELKKAGFEIVKSASEKVKWLERT